MLTREQNELVTRTGPGTAGGHLLRRFWQPVGRWSLDGCPQPALRPERCGNLKRDELHFPSLAGPRLRLAQCRVVYPAHPLQPGQRVGPCQGGGNPRSAETRQTVG